MDEKLLRWLERDYSFLDAIGIVLVLLMASSFQFLLHELPCPLCLLQRVGFIMTAYGFLLNLRFGLRPSHYSIALLGAIFTAFVSLRQIALHVIPGSGTYGQAILGLHLYSWSFLLSALVMLFTIIMLSFDRQYFHESKKLKKSWGHLGKVLLIVLLAVVLLNVGSVFFECGIYQCPDNPTHYLF